MEARPASAWSTGRRRTSTADQPLPRPGGSWRGTDVWSGADWIRLRCRAGHNCISSPEVVVRTSVQQRGRRLRPGLLPHQRPQHVAAGRRGLRHRLRPRRAAGDLPRPPRQHAAQPGRPDGRPARAAPRLRALLRVRRREPARAPPRCAALAGRALARQALWQASRAVRPRARRRGPDALPVDELVAFALEAYPRRAAAARVARLGLRRRDRRRPLALVPPVRRDRRGAPPARPPRPPALALGGV